jgi:taurine dioxygenase|tara:strand:- start:59 stop:871 length:813 start_codon:yes stop_codon:yes gene_type:complete
MFNNISFKPCKNNVGAIINLDLKKINESEIKSIKHILDEFGVIFFRNQNLTSENYIKFAKHFGECANYPMLKGLEGFSEITVVEKKPGEKIMFGEGWHTDSTYTKKPPKLTMLYSIKTPKKGKGNTQFASQYLSYEKLDDNFKKEIKDLKAIFSADGPISKTRDNRTAEKGTGVDPKSLSAEHKIVMINKNNKKKSIYLSPGHVTGIVGLNKEKSEKLLGYLFKHQVKPSFTYSFEWEPNCIAIWNNHAILHNPVNDFDEHRVMHRITVQ